MPETEKNGPGVIELPHPSIRTNDKQSPPYVVLNPNGSEIFKVSAKYPSEASTRQCKLAVYWKGGPAGAHTSISLIDIKNWVAIASIWSGINVKAGEVGTAQFTIPINFKPTDDSQGPATYPLKPGMYQIYIQNSDPTTTWTYGPEFTIV